MSPYSTFLQLFFSTKLYSLHLIQVVGIDQGPEHVMTVWNWETEEESGKLLGKVATHQASVNIVQ
jgi:hypothetical protein